MILFSTAWYKWRVVSTRCHLLSSNQITLTQNLHCESFPLPEPPDAGRHADWIATNNKVWFRLNLFKKWSPISNHAWMFIKKTDKLLFSRWRVVLSLIQITNQHSDPYWSTFALDIVSATMDKENSKSITSPYFPLKESLLCVAGKFYMLFVEF